MQAGQYFLYKASLFLLYFNLSTVVSSLTLSGGMALPINIPVILKVCVGAHFRRQCLAAAVGGGAYSDVEVCTTFFKLNASPGAVLEDDESVSAG